MLNPDFGLGNQIVIISKRINSSYVLNFIVNSNKIFARDKDIFKIKS